MEARKGEIWTQHGGRGGDTGVRKLDLDAGGHGWKKVLVVWV